ncbi:hypothetical protein EYZ11_009144 [Aspergillus tanneri]|uniref:Putative secondary metabolism biosynthetic enzyme n=1 Tax=Aspergillus tanneri TaxID=1220188 RepID=A0A4S3J926_9EURO|nr:putative secondary metabolism biosynthetic enzyme [Aspergillus tanneri]KAA8643939.1 putative secondary metabolism biosynthetic enzyme [Aspergillus tanneri]THC91395.1 hypothetical protein EYZ11_009144 [Aspergillus tanneri]
MGIRQYDSSSENVSGPSSPETLATRFGRLHILDDLIRLRAEDVTQYPLLAYPRPSTDGHVSYEYFTGQDLDWMVDQVVCTLMDYGFKPPRGEGATVALFTTSDMNMVVTFFALSRLGYTVMMLSPRLSAVACVSLLDVVGCDTVLYGQSPSIRATMGEILRLKLVTCRPIIARPSLQDTALDSTVMVLHRSRNPEIQKNKIALVLHSSGSTGTPKPLFLSHKALMTHPTRGPGLTSFNSLPWYHLHGLSTALQAMYMRKTAFMWDASLPLTATSVVAALEAAQPESVQGVPYMLQLLVDNPRGLEALRNCKLVTYGGAPCPDELGDRMVEEKVRFGGSFGLTEAGLVAESISRPASDPYWNYMKFFDNIQSYVWMKPIGNELYECVYLLGHPALTTSNSNEPPGSYHSKDVFTPHPVLPNRWKYVTRLDDRITLVNGEKVLPLPIEGSIKQSPLVHEAVVVGVNRSVPGLLVFRSDEVRIDSDSKYLDRIWPVIEEANSRAEQFSQISRDMVVVLPWDAVCPRTDKGSMIRAQVYAKYADVIDKLYAESEQTVHGTVELDVNGTEELLMKLCRDELGIHISSVHSEFFAEGVDSLKAIHMRRLILQHFKIQDSQSVGQNVVFETGTISRLAEYIHAVQDGQEIQTTTDEMALMPRLIEKYSSFFRHKPNHEVTGRSRSVILTGATGSTGAHTLYRLLNDDSVSAVYCLTRRAQPKESILQAMAQKGLNVPRFRSDKIIALQCSLEESDFGVDYEYLRQMKQSVSLIIHTAWPVNFNLPLKSFEPHIKGLYNLINFSLSVNLPKPAVLLFCSSISTALGSSSPTVDEVPMDDLHSALDMGYARSKLIGEQIISNARKSGARSYSLRTGQISGHSKRGLWNDNEAIPLMIRSALTLHALPDLKMTCSWLPVDKLVSSILEIAKRCSTSGDSEIETETDEIEGDDTIYNLCNPREFTWSSMLDTLRRRGFTFSTVPFSEWLRLLRESESRGEETVNPAVKLADHYEAMYGHDQETETSRMPRFLTEKAERDSMTLRNGRLRIIEDGILSRYALDWLNRWKTA